MKLSPLDKTRDRSIATRVLAVTRTPHRHQSTLKRNSGIQQFAVRTGAVHQRVTSRLYLAPHRACQTGATLRGTRMSDFGSLVKAEIPRLRRYARALTRDAVRADDLVQSCLVRAIAKQHLWERGTNLRAWLFTILHNQHVNDVRHSIREGSTVELDEAPQLTTQGNAIPSLELRDLERAIGKLPSEQRQVILLVGLEGMAYEEVATVLDVPVGTVRSRLSRGRDQLRRLMGVEERAEADAGARAA